MGSRGEDRRVFVGRGEGVVMRAGCGMCLFVCLIVCLLVRLFVNFDFVCVCVC